MGWNCVQQHINKNILILSTPGYHRPNNLDYPTVIFHSVGSRSQIHSAGSGQFLQLSRSWCICKSFTSSADHDIFNMLRSFAYLEVVFTVNHLNELKHTRSYLPHLTISAAVDTLWSNMELKPLMELTTVLLDECIFIYCADWEPEQCVLTREQCEKDGLLYLWRVHANRRNWC